MKISFFGVDNFRTISGGIENNKIIFKDTNTLFIYGANNAGKSTFLKAYVFFIQMKNLQVMIFINVMIKILSNSS